MSLRSHSEVASCAADAEVFGAYALTHQLGAGLLTRVHAALALADGSAWTLKRLQPAHTHDAQARALLLAAGRAVMGVSAPFLVGVHEVNEQPEPHLVLQRVDGVDLAALLAGVSARDAVRFALPVIIDALHGLHCLHTLTTSANQPAGLVHGAPHARHMLVGADGRGRVLDPTHGVGPAMPWSAGRDPRLEPRLVAPEQVLAPAHVDARADLYVVGSVLWQALTGRALVGSVGEDGAPRELLQHAPPAPSEVGASWGRGLDRVCTRALDRARSRRFPSAAEMATALQEEAERSVPLASPDEIGALVRTLSSRPRSAEAGQLAARVTLLGVGGREPSVEGASALRRTRTADGRARRITPQALPALGATATFTQDAAAREPASSEANASPASRTQLEIGVTRAHDAAPVRPSSAPYKTGAAPLRWQEPSASLPPKRRGPGAPLKLALMGLALTLPGVGLALGFSAQGFDLRTALEQHLGVTIGAAASPEGQEVAGTEEEVSASTLPAAPPIEKPPAVDLADEGEAARFGSSAHAAQRPALHAPRPAPAARALLRRTGRADTPSASPRHAADASERAKFSELAPVADVPAALSAEQDEGPVPANPY